MPLFHLLHFRINKMETDLQIQFSWCWLCTMHDFVLGKFCFLSPFSSTFFQVSASAFGCFVPYIVSLLVFRSNPSNFAFVKSIIPAPYLHPDTACELVALIMFFVNLIGIHSMQDWTTTFEAWSYKKKKHKKIAVYLFYRKSV